MNIPNILTLLRVILVPVIVILLIDESYFQSLVVLTISGLTDVLDGFLARRLNMQTILGAYMDPIADKALISSCYIALAITGIIPSWLAVIIISRDVIILLGILVLFLLSVPVEINPSRVSKITTVFQVVTVILVLFAQSFPASGISPLVIPFFWFTGALTVISGLSYMIRGVRLIGGLN